MNLSEVRDALPEAEATLVPPMVRRQAPLASSPLATVQVAITDSDEQTEFVVTTSTQTVTIRTPRLPSVQAKAEVVQLIVQSMGPA
jgi:hypothetical protein